MKQIAQQFLCNIKEDTYHCFADQIYYWGLIRPSVLAFDIHHLMNATEMWLFMHGWLVLLLWRLVNASMDTWKRIRDMQKPEWESQIVPVLREEAKRDRKLKWYEKILRILKYFF